MKNSKKLSDLLFSKPTKVKEYPKLNLNKPIPVGHLLAVMCYDNGLHLETLFIDNIDIVNSHTVFHFNKYYSETLCFDVMYSLSTVFGAEVWYKNGASINIIRIA
jgi:hypothetical protein